MPYDWRMRALCANCPFRTDGAAIELRPGRLERIKEAVALSQPFHCHKTTHGQAPGERQCAGALDYRDAFYREHGADGIKRLFEKIYEELKSGTWDGAYG